MNQQTNITTNSTFNSTDNTPIDEELYSRQLYVLGHEAMRKMKESTVVIVGLDGLGQEIAKNVILAGVSRVCVYDRSVVTAEDLSSGFYMKEAHISMERGRAVFPALSCINRHVKVELLEEIEEFMQNSNLIVVSINQDNETNVRINNLVRCSGSKFVMANSRGFFAQLFVDFNRHTCFDKSGQRLSSGMINHLTESSDNSGNSISITVSLADGAKHQLEEGDSIKIINKEKEEFLCDVISTRGRKEFSIEHNPLLLRDSVYEFEQVKKPFEIRHSSLEECIKDHSKIAKYEYINEEKLHMLFCKENVSGELSSDDIALKKEFENSAPFLIAPMCSVLGGFAAQEVIKAASGKFTPLNQFYYYHCAGLYQEGTTEHRNRNKAYISLLGEENYLKMQRANIFLVGAGAIGCENIKNFVMTGIGSLGTITVTDMDSIEKSNLNRQFLFKEEDVGLQKSERACVHAVRMNPVYEGHLVSSTTAVREDTENIFSDRFYEGITLVSNALDNVKARLYIDERCVQHCIPMVDAGTLGTKGHVQVVIPHLTESYGSSTDPEEESIPLCTIRSYPNCIEHTIEWALAEFKELWSNPESDTEEIEATIANMVQFALYTFNNQFNMIIGKLLSTFPPDHVTEGGTPFWLPPKKIPHILQFDRNDEMHMTFVTMIVKLYCEGNKMEYSLEEVERTITERLRSEDTAFTEINPVKVATPVEFEKDSYHSDFIWAAANLRARNYEIKEQSNHHIKGIAGKIIPAIATTTAMVSGLATLEIMKILKSTDFTNSTFNTVKNYFLDLAHPMLTSADPVECEKLSYKIGEESVDYTLWSKHTVDDDLLKNVLSKLTEYYKDEVSMLAIGSKVIYWDVSKKYHGNLEKKISEIVQVVEGQKSVYMTIVTDNEEDKETVEVRIKER